MQRDENYPSQSLLEAMACENAVIATNVGLTKAIVKDSFGILINSNETELFNAITNLISCENKLAEMGKQARMFVMSNHKVELFHHYLMSIYKDY